MDRRVARTKSSLQRALLELARDRPLEAITVRDVTNHADVNRSSFYQYYSDKDELLAAALDDALQRSAPLATTADEEPGADASVEVLDFFRHIADNVEVYRHILGNRGSANAMTNLQDRMTQVIGRLISARDDSAFTGVPPEVVASAFAGLALGLIQAWIVRTPLPPAEDAVEWMTRIILRGEVLQEDS